MDFIPKGDRPITTRLRPVISQFAPKGVPKVEGRTIAPSIHKISHVVPKPLEEAPPPKPDVKRRSKKEEKRAEKAALVSDAVRELVESNPSRSDVIEYFKNRIEALNAER